MVLRKRTREKEKKQEIFRHCLSHDRAAMIFVLLYQAAMRKAAGFGASQARESLKSNVLSRSHYGHDSPPGQPEIASGHESQIELWLPSEQHTGKRLRESVAECFALAQLTKSELATASVTTDVAGLAVRKKY
jgi:hypothetical protein